MINYRGSEAMTAHHVVITSTATISAVAMTKDRMAKARRSVPCYSTVHKLAPSGRPHLELKIVADPIALIAKTGGRF